MHIATFLKLAVVLALSALGLGGCILGALGTLPSNQLVDDAISTLGAVKLLVMLAAVAMYAGRRDDPESQFGQFDSSTVNALPSPSSLSTEIVPPIS